MDLTPQVPLSEPTPEGRLERVLLAAAARARRLVGKVRVAAGLFAGAGVVFWGALFYPFDYESAAAWVAVGALGLAFLVPAGVVYLFYLGLGAVIRLPERLAATAGAGRASAASAWNAAMKDSDAPTDQRALKLVGAIRDLRGLVSGSKDLLVQYSVLFRMVNPLVLIVVGLAWLAGAGLVVAAVIALVVVL